MSDANAAYGARRQGRARLVVEASRKVAVLERSGPQSEVPGFLIDLAETDPPTRPE